MLSLLSRIYVYTLAPLLLLLLLAVLILHVALLAGSGFEPDGRFFAFWFGINLPILGLAESNNIWANEVKQSPRWLATTFHSLFAYSLAVTLVCGITGDMHVPKTFFLAASAFMLSFTVGSSCVLWVTLRSVITNPKDLMQRVRQSLIGIAVFSAAYVAFSFFPAKQLHP
jgi:hypothetical protein